MTGKQISFESKISKTLVKSPKVLKTAAAAAVTVSGINTINVEANPGEQLALPEKRDLVKNSRNRHERLDIVKRLESLMEEAVNSDLTLTIPEISKITGIPTSHIISIIYRSEFTALKENFDKIKDRTRLYKCPTERDINFARKLAEEASGYAIGGNEFIPIEEDYVLSLANDIMRGGYSEEILDEFAKQFKKQPAFADMLLSTKNSGGYYRTYYSAEKLKNLFNAHLINPDLTEELFTEENEDGSFKYCSSVIYKIVNANEISPKLLKYAKEDPHIIDSIINRSDVLGNPRFGADDTIKIYEYYKKFPNLTKKLIRDSIPLNDNSYLPRFNGEQIISILDSYPENPDLVLRLINTKTTSYDYNAYKYNGEAIEAILNGLKSNNPELKTFTQDLYDYYEHDGYADSLIDYLPKRTMIRYTTSDNKYIEEYIPHLEVFPSATIVNLINNYDEITREIKEKKLAEKRRAAELFLYP